MLGVLSAYFLCVVAAFAVHFIREFIRPTLPEPVIEKTSFLLLGVVVPLCSVVGVWLSTIATAVLLWALCTHYDGKSHFGAWHSICLYASSHHLLGLIALPIALPFDILFGQATVIYIIALVIALFACGVLATFTIDGVVRQRTKSSALRSLSFVGVVMTCAVLPTVLTIFGVALYTVLADG